MPLVNAFHLGAVLSFVILEDFVFHDNASPDSVTREDSVILVYASLFASRAECAIHGNAIQHRIHILSNTRSKLAGYYSSPHP